MIFNHLNLQMIMKETNSYLNFNSLITQYGSFSNLLLNVSEA